MDQGWTQLEEAVLQGFDLCESSCVDAKKVRKIERYIFRATKRTQQFILYNESQPNRRVSFQISMLHESLGSENQPIG